MTFGADQTTACSVTGGFSFECNSTSSCGKTDREADWARVVASDNVDELHGRLVILQLLFWLGFVTFDRHELTESLCSSIAYDDGRSWKKLLLWCPLMNIIRGT